MALKLRAVVVGLGSIGRRHARLLAERANVAVEWCESSAAALAEARQTLAEPGCVHDSFERVLQSRPDVVVLATPHAAHAPQTVAALGAGIHVLCEKPMAETLAEAERMAQAADASRAILAIGFHLHFHPGLVRLKELITSGALGTVHHAHCRVGSYVTLVNSKSRYQRSLAGALLLDYAHQPDILTWLLGQRPRGVYMIGAQGGRLEHQSNPNVLAVACDYEGPLLTTIHLNYLQMPERHDYEIVGDRGWASLDLAQGSLRIGLQGDSSEQMETFSTERDPVYRAEHAAFFDAVAKQRKPESAAGEAIVSMRIIAAALESWSTQRRIEVGG
ncbi:MAG: Oxidoreductase domain protein [Verrucomicrobia bacterium]|nr:Oxidoreductase domain protein [Verrucomicrobiota bacterium]